MEQRCCKVVFAEGALSVAKTHIKGRKKGRIKRTKMHEIAVKIVSIKELKGRISVAKNR